jgi:hypothetical protein
VPAVPTDLGQLHRRQASVARLATMGAPSAERGSGPMALGVIRRTAAPPAALPAGAALRSCDDKGRMKPGFARPLAELLGWEDGALACHAEGPWLVLTQPEALRGARRIRNSTRAHLNCSGTERLCLSPAQAHAVLGAARQVFLVPVPEVGALVVADPGAFLSGAPASVARLFDPPAARPFSLVAEGAGEKGPFPAHAAAEPCPTRKEP